MRRVVLAIACLFVITPTLAVAQAATSKGVVAKSWISTTSGGVAATTFSAGKTKRLYANFTWKTPAKAGQKLAIEWHDPSGVMRAVWSSKTLSADKKGTRLFAWVGNGVVNGKLGSWTAVLTVGTTRVGTAKFRVKA